MRTPLCLPSMSPFGLGGATTLALALLMTACASSERPAAPQLAAEIVPGDSERVNGALLVEPDSLQRAQWRLAQARELLNQRHYDQARTALNLARAEAQLARGLAEDGEARRTAEEVERQIQALRRELPHNSAED